MLLLLLPAWMLKMVWAGAEYTRREKPWAMSWCGHTYGEVFKGPGIRSNCLVLAQAPSNPISVCTAHSQPDFFQRL